MSTDTPTEANLAADPDDGADNVILQADDLHVSYGKVAALRGVDLNVEQGMIASVIGPNGAGKSTLANTIAGFLDYEGSLKYRGEEVADSSQARLVKNGLIYTTEERDLFGFMDVEDNLELGAYLLDSDTMASRKEFVYDLFPRLEERRGQNARSMSGGEQQMLAIGRALMGDPKMLVLDEPALGLAPVILQSIAEVLDPIIEQGVTVLLMEQNVTFALKHSDYIHLLENGKVVRQGTPGEFKGDDYIRESYLGN
jgi:branched-chain amino acid transport system ATP-binding protein